MLSITFSAAILLFLLYIAREIRAYYNLKQFGGPWIVGFSRIWLYRSIMSGRMNIHFTELNDKYGSTARSGPNHLMTCDPALIRRMNAVRSSYTRSEWYKGLRLHPTRDNITSYRDEATHMQLRNQMALGYSGKENLFLEQDIDKRLLQLIDLMKSKYTSSSTEYRPFCLARLTTFFTLDVISTVAFGRAFGFLERDEDHFDYINQLNKFLPAVMLFGSYPELQSVMRLPFMQALAPKATDAVGLGKVMGFAKEVVAERFGAKPIVRKDMLGSFLAHGLSQEQLESETLTQITAGSDSSSTAIRMTIFLITTSPQIYTKLMAELDDALNAGKFTRPIMTDAESRQLPYLQACIKEGLRMYPPVTGLLAKQSPPEGDWVDGKFIPGGVQIGWNSWGLMRRKDVFGNDPEVFRPERWFAAEDEEQETAAKRIENMEGVQGMVFGYGRFGCLGKNVAVMELDKAVAELLLRFNFQIANPEKPFESTCIGFFLMQKMIFRLEERTTTATSQDDGARDVLALDDISY
ncbi:putative P450 monooxygenase [Patellaria atrata CBS 101060]|uniref:P450 monooxygenase n=1 Tax=Patellaria atrata CBS 101060 TaxID=1346257 RepID=A0A9P4VQE4_9PEZI|nr:putative P450 monooxygenase [Patellaria atrata CBS 101060]